MSPALLLILVLVHSCMNSVLPEVTIDPVSTFYLPEDYSTLSKGYLDLRSKKVVATAYDPEYKIIYTVGDKYLHVINASVSTNLQLMTSSREVLETSGSDVIVCRDFLLFTTRGSYLADVGKLWVYSKATDTDMKPKLISLLTVGPSPVSISATTDCQTIVVANQGQPGVGVHGYFTDPAGSVTILTFPGGNLHSNPSQTNTLDFTQFDADADSYIERGARLVYKGNKLSKKLSLDLTPRSVTLNTKGTRAYVALQVNNAIVEIDIEEKKVLRLHPLGYKDWMSSGLDPSDKDGGIHIQPWEVRGLFQPCGLHYFQHGGQEYLVTANEGAAHEFSMDDGQQYTDQVKASVIVDDLANSVSDSLKTALQNDTKLGRIRISTQSGYNSVTRHFEHIYTFGGRGFSVWHLGQELSLVYDSEDEVERQIAHHYPTLFNSDIQDTSSTPEHELDASSDDKGPQLKFVDVLHHGSKTYLVFTSETLGGFMVYSLEGSSVWPKFEVIFRPGQTGRSWQELYDQEILGDLSPNLQILPADISPTGTVALLIGGSVSGTVSLYNLTLPEISVQEENDDHNTDSSHSTCAHATWWRFATLIWLLLKLEHSVTNFVLS